MLSKSNVFLDFSDNLIMKTVTGITISVMAEELGIEKNAVLQRLYVAKIKPLSKEAIYPESALEAIRNVPGKGRPKKTVDRAVVAINIFSEAQKNGNLRVASEASRLVFDSVQEAADIAEYISDEDLRRFLDALHKANLDAASLNKVVEAMREAMTHHRNPAPSALHSKEG